MSELKDENATTSEPEAETATPAQDEPVAREAAADQDNWDGASATTQDTPVTALFTPEEAERFRSRWNEVQAGFVDNPRDVVQKADGLVGEVMDRLTKQFAETRESLEAQWGRSEDVSTEDLRVALQRYRSFFERLLSA